MDTLIRAIAYIDQDQEGAAWAYRLYYSDGRAESDALEANEDSADSALSHLVAIVAGELAGTPNPADYDYAAAKRGMSWDEGVGGCTWTPA